MSWDFSSGKTSTISGNTNSRFARQKQLDELRRKERLRRRRAESHARHVGAEGESLCEAEKFLATAVGNLKGEEGMDDLSVPLAGEHDRMAGVNSTATPTGPNGWRFSRTTAAPSAPAGPVSNGSACRKRKGIGGRRCLTRS